MTTITEGALPGTADADGWRRLHPLSPLLRGGIALIIIVGIVIANFRDRFVELFVTDRVLGEVEKSDDSYQAGDIVSLFRFLSDEGLLTWALLGIAVVLIVIILLAWVSWRFSTYRITGEAVESKRGVLFRNHRRAPLERIQSVNLQRSLPARILGLTKIEVLTGGQGGKVELAYLGYRDAKTVREQILVRAAHERGAVAASQQGAPDSAMQKFDARLNDFIDEDISAESVAAHTLVRVPVGRLITSILLAWEGVTTVLAIIIAVAAAFTGLASVVMRGPDAVAGIGSAVVFGAVPFVLVMIGVIFTHFNKGFRFTLSQDGEAVRTGSGLTATSTETIPLGRIHAIEARQPLLWRPFGWWRVRMTLAGHSAAQGGQNTSQNVVLPVGSEADALRVLSTLLPGIDADTAGSLLEDLSGPGTGFLRSGRRSGWVLLWGKRRAGIRIADRNSAASTLRIRRGALTRSLSIMPMVRAQSIQLRRPLVHRMLGLASLQAHTVMGPVRMEMRGISLDDARLTFDGLAREVLTVQGADAQSHTDALKGAAS